MKVFVNGFIVGIFFLVFLLCLAIGHAVYMNPDVEELPMLKNKQAEAVQGQAAEPPINLE